MNRLTARIEAAEREIRHIFRVIENAKQKGRNHVGFGGRPHPTNRRVLQEKGIEANVDDLGWVASW